MKRSFKRLLPFVGALLTAAAVVHCSADGTSSFNPNTPPLSPEAAAETGSFGGGDGRAPIPPSGTECLEENKQIYVLATDKALYRFYPDTLKFVRIGQVSCPTTAGTFSMAVNKLGFAFVEYTDGRLFIVDTATAICYTTPFVFGQKGFETFGMGFARDGLPPPDAGEVDAADAGDEAGDAGADAAEGGIRETLYVAGSGLASLDTDSFKLNFLGSLTYGRTELTARDTELFAFSIESGVIAGVDKTTAATLRTYRTTAIDSMGAFAFAQWGGDFWVFTGEEHSIVTQYSPDKNISKVVVQNTGMLIVGAGSSTCAPSTGPR